MATLPRRIRTCFAVPILSLTVLVVLSGCSRTASVSGTVTLEDVPLKGGGTITFQPVKGGAGASGTIADDGTYTIPNAPIGECSVTVGSGGAKYNLGTQKGQRRPVIPRSLNNVPKKFADPSTSGLKVTVKGGEQAIDIQLVP
jgi:hypothetical protein